MTDMHFIEPAEIRLNTLSELNVRLEQTKMQLQVATHGYAQLALMEQLVSLSDRIIALQNTFDRTRKE